MVGLPKELEAVRSAAKLGRWGWKLGVHWKAERIRKQVEAEYDAETAEAVVAANLLRYRGSAVVIDPKGELYEANSVWRAANFGPVYRIAPFDDGSDPATVAYARPMIRSNKEWFFTHPPLEARIEILEAELFVQRLPYVVARKPTQDRDGKVRRSRSLAN